MREATPLKTVKEDENDDEKDILYEFWKRLPPVTVLALPSNVMSSHPARPAILRILRVGVVDRFEEEPVERVRRALKADEIRVRLKEEGVKVSKTSLYFHLGVLEEHGLIEVVNKVLEGRHMVAHYGRTARGFIHRDPEESLEKYRRYFEEAGRLAKANRPGLDLGVAEELAEEYMGILQRRDATLADWMAENEELINENDVDFYSIFEFIKSLDSTSPEYVEFMGKVSKTLGIEL
jgi:DNA-binding transcriptional ArsR family regulator